MVFPAFFNVSSLNGQNGFTVRGFGNNAGISVSNVGDINGDGIADVIIGAPYANNDAWQLTGQCYVIYGSNNIFTSIFSLDSLNGKNGFIISGINANDGSGYSVSSAGDVNADNTTDVIIGAPYANNNTGQSYIIFGSKVGFSSIFELKNLNGTNGFVINGVNSGDQSGWSVSDTGDVNADNITDIIIGAPYADKNAGQSYVIYGSKNGFPAQLNLTDLSVNKGFTINGISSSTICPSPLPFSPHCSSFSDTSGWSVSGAGDVNADGVADIIIGAPGANKNGGQSYVIYGNMNGFPAQFSLAQLNGTNGFSLNATGIGLKSGWSVSNAGDVNADGYADVIIGTQFRDPDYAGQSYVVFGGKEYPASMVLYPGWFSGFIITDAPSNSVNTAGDVNGDKVSDIIIGGVGSQSYVILGAKDRFPILVPVASLNGYNGFAINVESSQNGLSASSAGDFNNDGIDDIIIGVPMDNVIRSYIIFSEAIEVTPTASLTSSSTITVTPSANSLTASITISPSATTSSTISPSLSVSQTVSHSLGSATPSPSPALFPAIFNVANLNGQNGFIINNSGACQIEGDINGDGIDDIISDNNQWYDNQGYILFGSKCGFSSPFTPINLDGSNGFSINTPAVCPYTTYWRFGQGVGDINNDGVDDFTCNFYCKNYMDNTPWGYTYNSYIVFGKKGAFVSPLTLNNNDSFFSTTSTDPSVLYYYSLFAGIGDINHDDIKDFVLLNSDTFISTTSTTSTSGFNYIFSGDVVFGYSGISSLPSSFDGTNGFVATGFSSAAVGSGDVNGDGVDDIVGIVAIVSESILHTTEVNYAVFAMFGHTGQFNRAIDITSLNGNSEL